MTNIDCVGCGRTSEAITADRLVMCSHCGTLHVIDACKPARPIKCSDSQLVTTEWINVKNGLPKPYKENVLISYVEDGVKVVDFGFLMDTGKFMSHTVTDSHNACVVVEGVTHWARVVPPDTER